MFFTVPMVSFRCADYDLTYNHEQLLDTAKYASYVELEGDDEWFSKTKRI